MFKPGDKVVCVNDNEDASILYRIHGNYDSCMDGLMKGAVYTVRSQYIDTSGVSCASIRLREIRRTISPNQGVEYGFASFRFVPYVPVIAERELEAVQ